MTISAPDTAVVDTVARIVADVLCFDEVGPDEDMFMLGMTSLSAIRIIARVNELFDIELDLLAAFEALTVRKLAELAAGGQTVPGQLP